MPPRLDDLALESLIHSNIGYLEPVEIGSPRRISKSVESRIRNYFSDTHFTRISTNPSSATHSRQKGISTTRQLRSCMRVFTLRLGRVWMKGFSGVAIMKGISVEVCMSVLSCSLLITFNKPSTHFSVATGMCTAADEEKGLDNHTFPHPLSWQPPPEFSARAKDVTTKGDITEIEVWQLIAPSATSAAAPFSMDELDDDNLSYSTLPVRGELLSVLDLTAKPNSTTMEFACPSKAEKLVVEMRCQRVACHVSFMQIDMAPRFGFELVRKMLAGRNNENGE